MPEYSMMVGSVGVVLLLLAFFLTLFSLLGQDSLLYIVMNVVGASLSCYASYLINYVPFVILEGAWAAVAMLGLAKLVIIKRQLAAKTVG